MKFGLTRRIRSRHTAAATRCSPQPVAIRVAIALTTALLLSVAGPGLSAADRPNILLIVSEDNGPELSCYGDPFVQTPVLDRLAAEGVRFQNAYVPQAGCSQSRAALILAEGRYALLHHDAIGNRLRATKRARMPAITGATRVGPCVRPLGRANCSN